MGVRRGWQGDTALERSLRTPMYILFLSLKGTDLLASAKLFWLKPSQLNVHLTF